MSYSGLRPLIETILDTVTELQDVKDTYTEQVSGYPAAIFEPTKNTNEMFTNTDNLREYSFDVIVMQELKSGRDAGIGRLCLAVDAVITAFDTDTTITSSGYAHYVRPVPAEWGEMVSSAGPVKFVRITVVCGIEVDVS